MKTRPEAQPWKAWPCEWDVGREPDRDKRSEPPTAAPPPGAIQTMKTYDVKSSNNKRYSSYLPVGTVPRP